MKPGRKVAPSERTRTCRAPHIESVLSLPPRDSEQAKLFEREDDEEIPPLLSDTDWERLQIFSGLKEENREELEGIIESFRMSRRYEEDDTLIAPAETRDRLKKAADAAHLLVDQYKNLQKDGAAYHLLYTTQPEWDLWGIGEFMEQVESFESLAEESIRRCRRGKPGPSNSVQNKFLKNLTRLWLSSTGSAISTTKKRIGPNKSWNLVEFLLAAAKMVDAELATEEAAITNFVKTMASRSKKFRKN
ncbi:hypothetical protein [Methylobacterium oxalidis]|uniref:hypothetical protein n=1 Tax=Methylobacterium oxalidis TaxID=944322 RepID=UPI003314FE77